MKTDDGLAPSTLLSGEGQLGGGSLGTARRGRCGRVWRGGVGHLPGTRTGHESPIHTARFHVKDCFFLRLFSKQMIVPKGTMARGYMRM